MVALSTSKISAGLGPEKTLQEKYVFPTEQICQKCIISAGKVTFPVVFSTSKILLGNVFRW